MFISINFIFKPILLKMYKLDKVLLTRQVMHVFNNNIKKKSRGDVVLMTKCRMPSQKNKEEIWDVN